MPYKPSRWRQAGRILLKLAVVGLVLGVALVVYLDFYVRARFNEHTWSVPARVYGAPLELRAGGELEMNEVLWWLDRMGYRPVPEVAGPGDYRVGVNDIELFTRAYDFWDGAESARQLRLHFSGERLTRLEDRHGERVMSARLAPPSLGHISPVHAEDRVIERLESMPPTLVAGLVAVEDRRFFQHRGVSLVGIGRALQANLRSRRVEQGGSTLTQQLIKNMFLTADQSLWRKGIEAIMAVQLELHVDKETILEAYMNEVFIAQDGTRSIHGFGLAAQHFYGRPLNETSLAQQAMLIGMLRGPTFYSPVRNPERAMARRNLVLDVMHEQGVITANQHAQARREGLRLNPGMGQGPHAAALDLVRRQLRLWYREEVLSHDGLHIHTTIDIYAQDRAQAAMTRQLSALEQQYGIAAGSLQGALILADRSTGAVRAVIGGRNSIPGGFNRALDARRPVGSLLKPPLYLAAMESGQHWLTPVDDSPVIVVGRDGSEWTPTNFDLNSNGEVPMWEALALSYNQAAARAGMELGLGEVLDSIERLGYSRQLPVFPSVILGAVDMSPYDIAQIYQPMVSGGYLSPLTSIVAVTEPDGRVLGQFRVREQTVIDGAMAQSLRSGLALTAQAGTGAHAGRSLAPELKPAGKTGTSDGQRDSWFAGEAGHLLGVVWIGTDDNQALPLTGSTGSLRLWTDLMAEVARPTLEPDILHSSLRWISWHPDSPGDYWLGDCQTLRLAVRADAAMESARYRCGDDNRPQQGSPETESNGRWQWLRRWF
ncbi:penicillin-binding protein 1B [Natronospirillum operosum]|uniref:Penicillin-binding protein 1B n=1 Tax=Natronospirillum operosum TaxID=2759953 RepID=A0A4Z0WAG3_9GAMM|nr:transglycosylase domain-containing protein [Natronospirillum operosum]TGG94179.1 penicillin-binding protein 1B [Natronospirillum operosum]